MQICIQMGNSEVDIEIQIEHQEYNMPAKELGKIASTAVFLNS